MLDIFFISTFIYIFISLFRESISRRTLGALMVVVLVYVLAQIFDLYLTRLLVKWLLAVALIITVVVFQADIRRMVDRLGGWLFFRQSPQLLEVSASVDILTESLMEMAENKTGALIAIRGSESWDHLLHGGVPLQGRVSKQLLISIFTPNSPGHDGAVMMDGAKVLRFGTHLPLSRQRFRVGEYGTRHAAALGLSEQSDALLLVVSEERGVVSVARHGHIEQVESATQLKTILEEFWSEHHSGSHSGWGWLTNRSVQTAIISVLLAFIAWLALVQQSSTIYRTYSVPIEARNLNKNFALENQVPSQAQITLSGTEKSFRLLNSASLVMTLDLQDVQEGENTYVLNEQNLNLPDGINMTQVDPRSLNLEVNRIQPYLLPVKVPTRGRLSDSLQLSNFTWTPKEVTVLFKKDAKSLPDSIQTTAVDLTQIDTSAEIVRALELPDEALLSPESNPEIKVMVEVKKNKSGFRKK